MAGIPVSAAVLVSARREHAGLSIETAAQRLGISIDHLNALEAGERLPSYSVLQSMATHYRVSLNHLILPNPLPFRKPKDYRTVANRQAILTHETKVAIRTAYALQDNIEELISEKERTAIRIRLSRVSVGTEIEQVATTERNRLEVSTEDQLSWKTPAQAFKQWRVRLEKQGILVYLFDMSIGDCRGFSILEPIPAISVNDREATYPARIFTLLHEYSHILLRKPGISDESRSSHIEWYCNQLAAAVLMPINLLREVLLLPADAMIVDWSDKQIATGARKIHVSQQALGIRLEHLGYARERFADRYNFGRPTEKEKTQKTTHAPNTTWAQKRLRRLGLGYSSRVLNALKRKDISEVTAYRMLNAKPAHFPAIRKLIDEESATYGQTAIAARR